MRSPIPDIVVIWLLLMITGILGELGVIALAWAFAGITVVRFVAVMLAYLNGAYGSKK